MAASKGYQLIEPLFSRPLPLDESGLYTTCAMLCWIADELTARGDLTPLAVTLEVIVAKYVGPYPCLALAYQDEAAEDVGDQVATRCLAFVEEARFDSYLRYLCDSKPRIDAFYAQLLTYGSA